MDNSPEWGLDNIGIGPYGNDTKAMSDSIRADASNILVGTNPSYLCADFINNYPQYGGISLGVPVTAVSGSNLLTVTNTTGISIGMLVVDPAGNIPDGTIITAITLLVLTISNNATNSATLNIVLYPTLLPTIVIQMYINLATASIMQRRWHSYWKIAIGWFVAHFCTLYLESMANPGSSAAQVVAAGQARGLMASKGVGDVSVSYDYNSIAQDLEGWAAWKLTIFGQQLATVGKLVGKGGMMV
jgi:hypothetical protein